MRRLKLPASALALFSSAVMSVLASASAGGVSDRDAFRLWAACAPVAVEVSDVSEHGRKIGLRRVDIETAVRSRLRAARLYEDKNAAPALIVLVRVFKGVFAVDVQLYKALEDRSTWSSTPEGVDHLFGFAATWIDGRIGTHGDRSDYILSTVAHLTDKFIDDYLRVNAAACGK